MKCSPSFPKKAAIGMTVIAAFSLAHIFLGFCILFATSAIARADTDCKAFHEHVIGAAASFDNIRVRFLHNEALARASYRIGERDLTESDKYGSPSVCVPNAEQNEYYVVIFQGYIYSFFFEESQQNMFSINDTLRIMNGIIGGSNGSGGARDLATMKVQRDFVRRLRDSKRGVWH
jgi:hypothetical protein